MEVMAEDFDDPLSSPPPSMVGGLIRAVSNGNNQHVSPLIGMQPPPPAPPPRQLETNTTPWNGDDDDDDDNNHEEEEELKDDEHDDHIVKVASSHHTITDMSFLDSVNDDDTSDTHMIRISSPPPAPPTLPRKLPPSPNNNNDSTSEDEDEVVLLHIVGVTFIQPQEKSYSSALLSPTSAQLVGTLSATAYALRFDVSPTISQDISTTAPLSFLTKHFFNIPMGAIGKIKGPKSEESSSRLLTIACRDVRMLNFRFESTTEALKVENLLRTFAFPLNHQTNNGLNCLYAFAKRKTLFGIDLFFSPHKFPSRYFRESLANREFRLVPTYPESFFVPATTSDDALRQVVTFRSKGRIPILCWYDDIKGGSIWRCSQPKVGVTLAFSLEDEAMVDAIRYTTQTGVTSIFDCRPQSSAVANRMRGMGYEDVSRYKNTKITFEAIANIHAVRASYASLCKLLRKPMDETQWENWMVDVESTSWLNHVRSILSASVRLAVMAGRDGIGCVVHCSDGWDRTAQVVSLAQVMLDGKHRTAVGFCSLIHHEWIMCGHRFKDRVGVGLSEEHNSDERSPVFIQFLDCVSQLIRQFPRYFAFDDGLLLLLAEHAYSCKFGEFLHNTLQEYLENSTLFVSLWTHLSVTGKHLTFPNAMYDPATATLSLLPRAGVVCRNVVLWDYFYQGAAFASSLREHV